MTDEYRSMAGTRRAMARHADGIETYARDVEHGVFGDALHGF